MSFLTKLTASLPFGKKEENKEYFFALNIGVEKLTAALWAIEGSELKILEIASEEYSSNDEIIAITDRLLDQVLGLKEIEPQKILFGVPNSWISDDNLKDEYLKILRSLVKELELTPMAYVSTSLALIHFLEKQEGVPTTAILVGFEKTHLTVTVSRAGKLDGVKVIKRGDSAGSDIDVDYNSRCAQIIEKALLAFTDVETLPSKILIYGSQAAELKNQLLSFAWMSKLSFLHFPKIDTLGDDIEIKSVCLAGGSELNSNIKFTERYIQQAPIKTNLMTEEEVVPKTEEDSTKSKDQDSSFSEKGDNFGFVVGDVAEQTKPEDQQVSESADLEESEEVEEKELVVPEEHPLEVDDFGKDLAPPFESPKEEHKRKFNFKRLIPKSFTTLALFFGIVGTVILLAAAYAFLLKADIKIYVEPKILEKDAEVVADPNQKEVDEDRKIIPGQIIETEVSGTAKDTASGKRQIGDPAKGTIVIYNKTNDSLTLSKGTQVTGSGGIKFTLDTSANVASQSASDSGITFGKANTTVTAVSIGADGNLPSGSDFTVAGFLIDKVAAKSEGNFSGGTSKDVTVVSTEDQQKLLAKLSSEIRQQAQQELQEKFPDKKILEEALSEATVKKSYNKNINDQASEFSLNMTVKYKGTAFDDSDLKTIVSKLVITQVPDNFELNLSETETQADVSKLEKDGKLIFLARFKAKLMPKIDTEKIKDQIKFKTPLEATDILKGMDNVLGSEIEMTPNLPTAFERLPILAKNISIEVGLK